MLLNELFMAKSPWEWTNQSDMHCEARFTVDNLRYVVTFEKDWSALTDDPGDQTPQTWDVEFKQIQARVDGSQRKEYGITGTGNAAFVLSTVIDIIRAFKAYHHNCTLTFNADEPSRKKLYSAIARRFVKTPHVRIDKTSGTAFYTIPGER